MTDLKNKLPVAPLTEARWRTIEEQLFDQLDREPVSMPAVLRPDTARPRRSRRTAAVFAFAAAATAAALLLLGVVIRDIGRGDPTARIATDHSASRLAFGDADIDVSPNSVVLLRGDAETGVLAIIERGTARFSVAPRKNRPPFAVSAGEVRVEVVGTVFSVSREGDLASVAVTEGKVRVRHRGQQALVTTGETWTPGAPATAEAPATDDTETDRDDARPRDKRRGARARRDRRNSRTGANQDGDAAQAETLAQFDDDESPEAPSLDLENAERDEDSTWSPLGPDSDEEWMDDSDDAPRADRRKSTSSSKQQRARRAKRERRERAREREAPQERVQTEVDDLPPVDTTPTESAADRYMRAAELEASSPKRALALYREIAGENNEWSEVAMFAWGRLELERGKKSAAAKVLKQYLSRYPRGRNRADAKALLESAED